MEVIQLVERNYEYASVDDDVENVRDALAALGYLVIIDNTGALLGLLTAKDTAQAPWAKRLHEFKIEKPTMDCQQPLDVALEEMLNSKKDYLLVYEKGDFIGILSIQKVTIHLLLHLREQRLHYQRIVHDLRNPLLNVIGLNQLIVEDDGLSDEQRQLLAFSDNSCKHALAILSQMLETEKSIKQKSIAEVVEMGPFYRQCIDEQLGHAAFKNIGFDISLSKKTLHKRINKEQVKSAIQTIIGNAIKFSHHGSKIKISSFVRNEAIVLKIADHGIGIPTALQPMVFRRFSSARRNGTNGEDTNGLGLYFAKQGIEDNQGSIHFKSEDGKGTSFYISL